MNRNPDIRWQQRFENFDRALTLLQDALAAGPAVLNQLEKEGVVQRFEYTLEPAWKTVRDFLEKSGVVLMAITPRQVSRPRGLRVSWMSFRCRIASKLSPSLASPTSR